MVILRAMYTNWLNFRVYICNPDPTSILIFRIRYPYQFLYARMYVIRVNFRILYYFDCSGARCDAWYGMLLDFNNIGVAGRVTAADLTTHVTLCAAGAKICDYVTERLPKSNNIPSPWPVTSAQLASSEGPRVTRDPATVEIVQYSDSLHNIWTHKSPHSIRQFDARCVHIKWPQAHGDVLVRLTPLICSGFQPECPAKYQKSWQYRD